MPEKTDDYLISVIPLTRIPLTREQFFYYTSSQKIPFGSLVDIPIGARAVRGITVGGKKDFSRVGGMQLKKVREVLFLGMLTEKQYSLAQFISDYYFASLGIVLRHFVFSHTKEIIKKKGKETEVDTSPSNTPPSPSAKSLVKILSAKTKEHCIYGTLSEEELQTLLFTATQESSTQKQTLIIVPEIISVMHCDYLLQKMCDPRKYALLHSKCTPRALHEAWERINTGECALIIGTRSALFAPFYNLDSVIVMDAQDVSHKQWDLTPRYDARVVGQKLAHIHNARHITISAAPRIVDHYRNQENASVKIHDWRENQGGKIGYTNSMVVDLRKERWKDRADKRKPNYTPLSYELQDTLKKTLSQKKQSLLFVNHQGVNAFSVCTKCKNVMQCPQCTRALVEQSAGHFRCLHCSFRSDVFPACGHCGNLAFRSIGIGTQQVESEVKKILPKARIARIDAQTMRSAKMYREFYQNWGNRDVDIVIGTQMVTKSIPARHLGCVAMIDADALLSLPEYTTDEKMFAHVTNLFAQTQKGTHKNILQTFSPELPIITAATQSDFTTFFQEQIDEREILSLPPFVSIIKLLYAHRDATRVKTGIRAAYEELEDLNIPDSTITQPHEPLLAHVRGKHRMQIIIKIKGVKGIPSALQKFLHGRDAGWVIDRDPISVL